MLRISASIRSVTSSVLRRAAPTFMQSSFSINSNVNNVSHRYFSNANSGESGLSGHVCDATCDHSEHQNDTQVRVNASDVPGTPGDDSYVMVFTCSKCDTRAARKFSKKAYHDGLVIIKCPGCTAMHLIADNIGWLELNKYRIATEMGDKEILEQLSLDADTINAAVKDGASSETPKAA